MSKLRVLIAGLGGIGQRHVRNLRALLGQDVAISAFRVRKLSHVLSDRLTIEPGQQLEASYGIEVFDDLTVALAAKPDAVFVCNPTSQHMPVALAAARAGCHLFIEKPLSHSIDGIRELATAAGDSLVTLVAYNLRFHPCLKKLAELLKQRAIGNVVGVRAEMGEYLPDWHPFEDYRTMYAARRELGGGVILSQIHDLDYLYSLFGLPTQLYAVGGHLSSLEIDVEDVASILMSCVIDGRTVPVHLHQDYLQRPGRRTCEVIGDKAKIFVDFKANRVEMTDEKGMAHIIAEFSDFERNQLFVDELKHFLACIRGEEKSLVALQDGVQSLRMALAAKKSIESGAVVALDNIA